MHARQRLSVQREAGTDVFLPQKASAQKVCLDFTPSDRQSDGASHSERAMAPRGSHLAPKARTHERRRYHAAATRPAPRAAALAHSHTDTQVPDALQE